MRTTASCTCFEYQVLGEQAPHINPVNRMNLLSIVVLTALIEAAGFIILELNTPGILDVDIVRNALSENKELVKDPFLLDLLLNADEKTQDNFQKFLSKNCLSSHMWILARS